MINITSSTVKEPVDNLALSNTVRPGVIGWAKSLAREVGPQGITVNSSPRDGSTRADPRALSGRPDRGGPGDDPARRCGTPREFGDVVCFLASDRASYVTGTLILVDGGLIRGLL